MVLFVRGDYKKNINGERERKITKFTLYQELNKKKKKKKKNRFTLVALRLHYK